MKKLFIYGFGYTAQKFVESFGNDFSSIIGSTRNMENINYRNKSFELIDNFQVSDYLLNSEFSHILVSSPPDIKGDPFYLNFRKFIKNSKNILWFGYLSATNVYGDHNGKYVDETSKTIPSTQKGKNRLLAENQWLSFCEEMNIPIHIFRLAGIYGQDRNIIKKVTDQKLINFEKKSQYFSRIYIDDLINILRLSMLKPNPFSIYNIADDFPSNITDVIEYVCQQINIPVPSKVNYLNDNTINKNESFFSENKRVNNKLIKNEFKIELKYPSYRDGYKELIAKKSDL